MQKTRIEWCDYTVNPVKGYCPMACPYCYARRMYDRFGWDKTIRFNAMKTIDELALIKKPSRIFWGSTMELFGSWVEDRWLKHIFHMVELTPQHTHIFLTKQPQNLRKWSPFPENCWIGVTATTAILASAACAWLSLIEAKVKFISIEPLLEWNQPERGRIYWQKHCHDIGWLIIGAETGNRKGKPPLEQAQGWAKKIIAKTDEAGIPVFIKDNLKLPARREWPK